MNVRNGVVGGKYKYRWLGCVKFSGLYIFCSLSNIFIQECFYPVLLPSLTNTADMKFTLGFLALASIVAGFPANGHGQCAKRCVDAVTPCGERYGGYVLRPITRFS